MILVARKRSKGDGNPSDSSANETEKKLKGSYIGEYRTFHLPKQQKNKFHQRNRATFGEILSSTLKEKPVDTQTTLKLRNKKTAIIEYYI